MRYFSFIKDDIDVNTLKKQFQGGPNAIPRNHKSAMTVVYNGGLYTDANSVSKMTIDNFWTKCMFFLKKENSH